MTQAVDAILNRISDLKDSDMQVKITYMGANGNAELSHENEIELMDIAAVLQQVEPDRAKEIFEKYPVLARAYQLFPDGDKTKGMLGMTMGMSSTQGNAPTAPNAWRDDFAINIAKQSDAMQAAAKNLQDGLDLIPKIPREAFQGATYIRLASDRVSSYPSVARDLLQKGIAILSKVDGDGMVIAFQNLSHGFDLSTRLKDEELKKRSLESGLDVAARMYVMDSDADDPNPLPFEGWPSVFAYREFMYKAVEAYKMNAVVYLDRIKEPDLLLMSQTALAAELLGRPKSGWFGGLRKPKKKSAAL